MLPPAALHSVWGRGEVTAHTRGTEPTVSGNTRWQPAWVAVQVISCNFNCGLKTAEPSPYEICEILLLSCVLLCKLLLDPSVIEERRMTSLFY